MQCRVCLSVSETENKILDFVFELTFKINSKRESTLSEN